MSKASFAAHGIVIVSFLGTLFADFTHGFGREDGVILGEAVQGGISSTTFSKRPFEISNREHDPQSGKPLIIGGEAMSTPCCVSWEYGRVDCFVRGPKSTVLHMTKTEGKHGDWVDIGGEVIGYVECVSRKQGSIELLAQGKDNSLQWIAYSGEDWSAWKSLGGNIMEAPSCVIGVGKRVDCTGRDKNNRVFYTRSLELGAWEDIGSERWEFQYPLKCLQRQERQHNCWSSSPMNMFRNIWRTTMGRWYGGDITKYPNLVKAQPSACTWNDGYRCDIFVLGIQNQMMHIYVDGYGGWQPWEDLGGTFESTPHCLSNKADTIHCIGVGQDSALHRKSLQDGKWSDWIGGWGSFLDGIFCLQTNEEEISCYMRGFDKAIIEVLYSLK